MNGAFQVDSVIATATLNLISGKKGERRVFLNTSALIRIMLNDNVYETDDTSSNKLPNVEPNVSRPRQRLGYKSINVRRY